MRKAKTRLRTNLSLRRPPTGLFWRSSAGVAAAEAVALALVFIGLSLMVGRILQPAIQFAARKLNQELAGTASP